MRGPFANFNFTIYRCYGLTDFYRRQVTVGRPRQHLADMLRGTLVLACAALDALNVDLLVGALPRAQTAGLLAAAGPTKKATREIVKELRRTSATPLAERARTHLRWITLQRPDAIEEMVVRVLGASLPWDLAANELTRISPKMWSRHDVRTALDDLVVRRDAIVHRADATATGGTRSVRVQAVEDNLLLVSEAGRAIRDVIAARLR